MSSEPVPADPVGRLCPACGLCCNGVLFADVELQPSDKAAALEAIGLALKRKGRHKLAFQQPCSCFDGKLCRAYAGRPAQCRAFECGVLKRVKGGALTVMAALKLIAQTQRQVQTVRHDLQRLGCTEEGLPLSRRYAKVMKKPIDLAGDQEVVDLRAKLMLDVDKLMKLLHHDFLT